MQDLPGAADRIIDSVQGVFDLAPSPEVALNNMINFGTFESIKNGGSSAQAIITDANADASQGFIRTIGIANEAKTLVQNTFMSYEDAIETRDGFLDRIDALAGETKNDTLYEGYRALRAQVANAVPGENNDLPRISASVLKQSMPSLVLAYDLYENVERELDILNRNSIRHPAFLPGGQNLSVLEYDEDTA